MPYIVTASPDGCRASRDGEGFGDCKLLTEQRGPSSSLSPPLAGGFAVLVTNYSDVWTYIIGSLLVPPWRPTTCHLHKPRMLKPISEPRL